MYGRHGAPALTVDGRRAEHPLAMLSGAPLRASIERIVAWARQRAQFRADRCEVDLGVTVTHLSAVEFPVHYERDPRDVEERDVLVNARRLSEAFNFTVRSDARTGHRPALFNVRPSGGVARDVFDLIDEPHELDELFPVFGVGYEDPAEVTRRSYNLASVMQVVRASAAFPGAFEPVPLEYTRVNRDGRVVDEHERELFIDGGVLDNTPLGLAIQLDEWRDARREQLPPLAESRLCRLFEPVPRTYVFVEPTITSYEPGATAETEALNAEERDLFGTYASFIGQFLGTALGAKLIETTETYPWIRRARKDRLRSVVSVPQRQAPVASEQLARFMAFFEHDFRVYDFYAGAADAEAFRRRDPGLSLMDTRPLADSPQLRCMLDYRDQSSDRVKIDIGDLPVSCQELGPGPLVLADGTHATPRQVERAKRRAIDRMDRDWDGLADARRQELRWAEAQLGADNYRAMIVAMHNYRWWVQGPRYAPDKRFDRFIAVLGDAGFRFVDAQQIDQLRFGDITADKMGVAVREEIGRALDRLARAQPTRKARNRLMFLGGVAADRYRVRWPTALLGLGWVAPFGLETYVGVAPVSFPMRFDVGARVHQFRILEERVDGEDEASVSANASAFGRIVFGVLRRPLFGMEVGMGGVVALPFSFGYRNGTSALRWGFDFSTAAVLFKHIFLGLQVDWYLDRIVRGEVPEFGNGEDVAVTLVAGYRFIF